MKRIIFSAIFSLFLLIGLGVGISHSQTYSITGSDSIVTRTGLGGQYSYTYAYIYSAQDDTVYFYTCLPDNATWFGAKMINLVLNTSTTAGTGVSIPAGTTYSFACYEMGIYGLRIVRVNSLDSTSMYIHIKNSGRY